MGAAIVHGAVPLANLVERQGQAEDLAGVDLAVAHRVDEFGQEARTGAGPPRGPTWEQDSSPRGRFTPCGTPT